MQNQISEEKTPESTHIGYIIKAVMFSHTHKPLGLPLWDSPGRTMSRILRNKTCTNPAQLLLSPEHLNSDCLYFGAWIGPSNPAQPCRAPCLQKVLTRSKSSIYTLCNPEGVGKPPRIFQRFEEVETFSPGNAQLGGQNSISAVI